MILDGILLAYAAFGAWRARRRRLANTLYRLARNVLPLASGAFCYRWVGALLAHLGASMTAQALGFVAAYMVPFIAIRRFRLAFTAWVDGRIGPERSSRWSTLVGFVAYLATGVSVLAAACLVHVDALQRSLARGSLLARLIIRFTSPDAP